MTTVVRARHGGSLDAAIPTLTGRSGPVPDLATAATTQLDVRRASIQLRPT
ncbi:hypothetical protein [Kribbella jejuensis]|uniref:hypothetical protein n=1 Tax=Kribbella jejuensis TaxID=236068 RepID=UPI00163A89E6|nr:hypothetical protein [Kribbella jejuensis]